MRSEDSGRYSGIDAPTRLGREAAGLGFVVLLLLVVPAALFDWSPPIIAYALLALPAVLGPSLLIAGIGLQRGARWAVGVLSAAAPALVATSVGALAYVLAVVWDEDEVGAGPFSLVPWPVAMVVAFPGILLWILICHAWSLRRGLQEMRRGGVSSERSDAARRPPTSALAVASFVLSLLLPAVPYITSRGSLGPEAALVPLLLALVAQVRIQRSRGRLGGLGFAAGAAVVYVLTTAYYPMFMRGEATHKAACLVHSKELAAGMGSYLKDHDGVYPPADSWSDALKPYVSADTFRCPRAKNQRCGFAFNAALGGRRAADVTADPARLVLFFESDAGWNAHGGPELLPAQPRHLRGDDVSYADEHVQWLHRARRDGSFPPYHWRRGYDPRVVTWSPQQSSTRGTALTEQRAVGKGARDGR